MDANYFAMTKFSVFGRGRQRGLRVGGVTYDELPKEMLMLVVPSSEEELVCKIIASAARSGEEGAFGDGKICQKRPSSDHRNFTKYTRKRASGCRASKLGDAQ